MRRSFSLRRDTIPTHKIPALPYCCYQYLRLVCLVSIQVTVSLASFGCSFCTVCSHEEIMMAAIQHASCISSTAHGWKTCRSTVSERSFSCRLHPTWDPDSVASYEYSYRILTVPRARLTWQILSLCQTLWSVPNSHSAVVRSWRPEYWSTQQSFVAICVLLLLLMTLLLLRSERNSCIYV